MSAFGAMLNGVTVGCNATIIRFMKGFYNLRPTEGRYCKTWDISKVLVFLRNLTPVRFFIFEIINIKNDYADCFIISL